MEKCDQIYRKRITHGGTKKKRKKRVWIVTHSFPPNAEVGGLRSLGLCQHLCQRGWEVTVICADCKNARLDKGLEDKIPSEAKIIRTNWIDLPGLLASLKSILKRDMKKYGRVEQLEQTIIKERKEGFLKTFKEWISLWIFVPDGRSGWFVFALLRSLKRALSGRPDVILSSGPTWTGMLVGGCLSKILNVSFVADFRDPWIGSAFHRSRRKFKVHNRIQEFLEEFVLSQAERVICAWDGIRKSLARRYPEKKEIMKTVVNGFDQDDFENLNYRVIDDKKCVFLHAGGFYGPRSPIPLFSAIQNMVETRKEDIDSALFVFLGNPEYQGQPLIDIAREYGVSDYVRVLQPVPQLTAFEYLKAADVAMLFGQSGDEALASIPAKAFEYIGLGKPVLSVGAGDEVNSILKKGGCKLWRVEVNDVRAFVSELSVIIRCYLERRSFHKPGWEKQSRLYTRKNCARQIEEVLLEITG